MRKRFTATMLAVTLAAAGLVGCGTPQSSESTTAAATTAAAAAEAAQRVFGRAVRGRLRSIPPSRREMPKPASATPRGGTTAARRPWRAR